MTFFSIIVHVVRTETRLSHLFDSFLLQAYKNFEVILVEDCVGEHCEVTFQEYKKDLNIKYFSKPEAGEGYSINFGLDKASGDFYLVIDPDCFLPSDYLDKLNKLIEVEKGDAVKGKVLYESHGFFTDATESAANIFAGISGNRRFFSTYSNSGFSKGVFYKTKGYLESNFGGNEELFLRINRSGFKVVIPNDLYIFKADDSIFKSFLAENFHLGESVAYLSYYEGEKISFVHFFPLILLSLLFIPIVFFPGFLLLIASLVFVIFLYSAINKKSVLVGLATVTLLFTQIISYSAGLIVGFLNDANR